MASCAVPFSAERHCAVQRSALTVGLYEYSSVKAATATTRGGAKSVMHGGTGVDGAKSASHHPVKGAKSETTMTKGAKSVMHGGTGVDGAKSATHPLVKGAKCETTMSTGQSMTTTEELVLT